MQDFYNRTFIYFLNCLFCSFSSLESLVCIKLCFFLLFSLCLVLKLVEAVFSSLKQRWNESIASRQSWHRWRELAIKVLVYNTKQLLCCQRAKETGVDLWKTVEWATSPAATNNRIFLGSWGYINLFISSAQLVLAAARRHDFWDEASFMGTFL